jgi:hypothetical protein
MLTESREAMRLRKPSQIPAIASLSSPQFDAKAISVGRGNVPDLPASNHCIGASSRWYRRRDYGNLPVIRIKFVQRDLP